MPAKTVAIIGAGVGGLATAAILAKAGYDVTVYETGPTPGGRMNKLEVDGFTFDTGPSWYLMKEVFEHFFGLFGKTTHEYYELARLNPAYKVFFESSDSLVITDNLENNLKLFGSIEPSADTMLRAYIRGGKANYQSALKYFLYNNFTHPAGLLRRDVFASLPALLPVISSSLHGYVSKRFKNSRLQQVLEYPSVFLGASPFNTPALYQLMSYLDFQEGVFYPKKGGMYSVIEALISLGKEHGVQYVYDSEVTEILTHEGMATGVIVNGKSVSADIVVSNSDLHHTEMNLLGPENRTYPEKYWVTRQAGPSALLMYLGIKGELPELEHHNLFFVKNWRKNFDDIYQDRIWPESASMYVSKTTATDASTAPEGHENVFVLVPLPPGVIHGKKEAEAFADRYLEQLETISGIHSLRSRIVSRSIRTPEYFAEQFHAWQNTALGMSHTLKQSAFFRPSVKSKKVKNLYYVGGGTQPGIGVPMCIISAQLVYKHLTGDTSPHRPDKIRSAT